MRTPLLERSIFVFGEIFPKKKPHVRKMFFFISLLLSLFRTGAQNQPMEFEEINSLQGLSHSTIYDITEDSNGFMWFGTREGLNKYDGYQIIKYYSNDPGIEKSQNNSELLDNEINCLFASKGGLYVGTQKGLNRYSYEKDNFTSSFSGKGINEPVEVIFPDLKENIFIGTTQGLYLIDKEDRIRKILENIAVRAFCHYKKNLYWVGKNERLLLINNKGEVLKNYSISSSEREIDLRIHSLFQDSERNIWLGTSKGLYRFDEDKDKFIHSLINTNLEQEANVIRAISEDRNNQLWLGTENGLYIYNKKSGKIRHYSHSVNKKPNSLSDKSIHSLHMSSDGRTWIGTYFGGVNHTVPKGRGFKKLRSKDDKNSLKGKAISEIIKVGEKLWIGTEDGGISIFDKNKNEFSHLNTTNGLSTNNVHSLLEDDHGNVWIGTFLGGLNKYKKATGKISSYKHEPDKPKSLSNDYVYSILQDRQGQLWIGTQNGLNIFNYKEDNFEAFRPEVFSNKFIYDMLQAKNGDLWICTRFSGIFRLHHLNKKLEHFTIKDGLSSNEIINVEEFSDGNIWFGTLNGGLTQWNAKKNNFQNFTKANGLPNNNIYGIVEAKDKNLWLTSNMGLTKFNPQKVEFRNYTMQDGLPSNQFNFKSAFKDDDGKIYFGSINGLLYFHPDSLITNLQPPKIHFTNFKLFNKEVPVTKKGILKEHINYTDSISLPYHQNVLTFEFAALNYPSAKKYAYKLEGFEDSWNKVDNNRTATYTNLSPGEYSFKVHTQPHNKKNQREIHLTILPPIWQTDWAYSVYLILLALSMYACLKFIQFIHKQRLAVKIEKYEKEKIQEVNQHKINFFTFISHEFKTPLTLIIASLEKYVQQKQSYSNPSKELGYIKRNAEKLQHLIQQLMEFRKTENPHTKLEYRKGDIILFLKDTFYAFSPLMDEKKFQYSLYTNMSSYNCYFDPDKLEMIITNLISNAIKSTPENGKLKFQINISSTLDSKKRGRLVLTVEDSGCGIAPQAINQIFDPFFKIENRTKDGWPAGSGIGLALVKSLCNLLGGEIEFSSKKDQGTKILLHIPLQLKIEKEKDVDLIEGNKEIQINPDLLFEETFQAEEDWRKASTLTLMIVEDNKEIIKLLQKHFSVKYKIKTAKNGIQALKKIKKYLPDIILSDVVMPEMDGISLCRQLRSDPITNHIPFLFLTGKTEKSKKLEGLRVGANAFISKPFSINELDLLVKNLLKINQNKAKRFSEGELKGLETYPKNNQKEEFLKKINEVVNANYPDPKFSIEKMANILGISRSLLHIKMKEATGHSASGYLKDFRLKRAAKYVIDGEPISEIAYKTGYSDPNYFSRVFKKEFQVSPSIYKRKKERHTL